ncbi:MAG TPA: glycoside hydrolase family 3 C-terminal domain-containing protein, partial [Cytophagaceae bacterium]
MSNRNSNIYRYSIGLFTLLIIFSFIFKENPRGKKGLSVDPIYKDSTQPIEARITDLISKMTLEEKIDQLSGLGFDSKENPRLGIPSFKMADGPVGVRNGRATAFPAGVAMGATWDTVLINRIGVALGKETRAKGLNYLLGPCVGIHRLPTGGRNFESFGEDPFLSSRLTVAYIKGLQSQKVISSVKHFAVNDQEWERMKYDVQVDERTMREIHFPMFKAAVQEADVWSVMSSYNKVNGVYASENNFLLNDILKKEWGFKGFVVSDWEATHSVVPSAMAGLDLEMPTGQHFGDSLVLAVKKGQVGEDIINDKVRRILRIKFKAGLFDEKKIVPDTSILISDAHKKLALDAARSSMVLLKNANNLLPLSKSIKSIAVIGPNAAVARTGGGGSSIVTPYDSITPMEGLKKKLGSKVKINYAQGDILDIPGLQTIDSKYLVPSKNAEKGTGLWGEYYRGTELKGEPVVSRLDKQLAFDFLLTSPDPKLEKDGWSTRWTGKLKPPVSRKYKIYSESDDGIKVWFDNKLVIDNWGVHGPERDSFYVDLVANKPYDIKIEYFEGNMGAVIRLGWDLASAQNEKKVNLIEQAVQAAKQSDVAVIFAGFSHQYEGESFDRKGGLELPGKQNELIKAVVKANPKTIVVLNNGTAVLMNQWLDATPALIEAWYPGQAGGTAIADILFGDYNPSGKMPVSFVKSKEDS